jgi:hypothetical protein
MEKLRKIEDEFEARACLGEVARSGEPLSAWARARGIDGRSLHAWRMNLSRGSSRGGRTASLVSRHPAGESPALVELVPTTAIRSPRRYAIAVDGVSLEFGDDFEDETLRRALGVLRSC